MKTRRQAIKGLAGFFVSIGLFFTPFFSICRLAFSQTQKILLPKGTKWEDLVGKNPATLDTRNLEITPLEDFKTMGLSDLRVDLNQWRLEVDGHVKRPLKLTYEEIIALPSIKRDVLLICPGIFVNHGRWRGIPIGELLQVADMENGITHVTIRGPQGDYGKVQQYPIEDILSKKVFLAYQVNGATLPEKHGFPIRVVAEGYYGYDWVKYVYRITADKV